MPRWLRYSTLIAISFASIAMLGLAISLFNPKLFDRYFPFLLVLNAVIAAVLFCVVTTLCLRLARRQRSKQYGSHMTAKLALTTALISVVPTLTVYAISTAFISRSLQDSFSPRVEASLDAGVRITQEMLAKQEQSTQELARDFADALAGTPDSLMLHDLLKLLEPHSGTEALFRRGGCRLPHQRADARPALAAPAQDRQDDGHLQHRRRRHAFRGS